jgi:hypothetical protein
MLQRSVRTMDASASFGPASTRRLPRGTRACEEVAADRLTRPSYRPRRAGARARPRCLTRWILSESPRQGEAGKVPSSGTFRACGTVLRVRSCTVAQGRAAMPLSPGVSGGVVTAKAIRQLSRGGSSARIFRWEGGKRQIAASDLSARCQLTTGRRDRRLQRKTLSRRGPGCGSPTSESPQSQSPDVAGVGVHAPDAWPPGGKCQNSRHPPGSLP